MTILARFIVFLKPYAIILLVLWIVAIITVSSTPNIPPLKIHTSKSDIRLDYLIHFIEYSVLGFLALLSFERKDFKMELRKVLLIIAFTVLFAAADEFHQKFVPGRTFNPVDLLSNVIGIAGGLIFYVFLRSAIREQQDVHRS